MIAGLPLTEVHFTMWNRNVKLWNRNQTSKALLIKTKTYVKTVSKVFINHLCVAIWIWWCSLVIVKPVFVQYAFNAVEIGLLWEKAFYLNNYACAVHVALVSVNSRLCVQYLLICKMRRSFGKIVLKSDLFIKLYLMFFC